MSDFTVETAGGITIRRTAEPASYETAIDGVIERFDGRPGALFSSNYEYPGRYTRWDAAVVDPPLMISSRGRAMRLEPLNDRGRLLAGWIADALEGHAHIAALSRAADGTVDLTVAEPTRIYTEEERSKAPTVFSVLRAIVDLFRTDADPALGLYGAFGYDLCFQFDPIDLTLPRADDQRDMALFLPDQLVVVDHYTVSAQRYHYSFERDGARTGDLDGDVAETPFQAADETPGAGDHAPGEYAALVDVAKESFRAGDLFEVVPGQVFYEKCLQPPAATFRRLRAINPSPYGFFMNLGRGEYLVGASPEMFVRVTGRRVETCPISGTIRRGEDAIEDSEQILKLLNSKKDEAELTMCSDVDRNDKSRVCEPGSVRLIGRRQIEMYSRLIHTVDHIEGRLREGMDGFDAFLSHAWAVTVTGAPKLWAMRFIEAHEKSPRAWYGGAVGMAHFNGDMNTGLTLRTIHIKDGYARVRAGATLLYDSIPDEEEKETELKASALRAALKPPGNSDGADLSAEVRKVGAGKRILLVDHEDSFVHTLANYFRQTGAEVVTVRTPVDEGVYDRVRPDLVVLSPGPGSPSDFQCAATIEGAMARKLPMFGVCLGLQALAEQAGARLDRLAVPMHGKPSRIQVKKTGRCFATLANELTVGRYHSLHVKPETLPGDYQVTAVTEEGVVMAIEHGSLPIAAVQFHPESIMSLGKAAGMRIIENVVESLTKG
ncbi:MAG: anthranilate synthase [Marivibrio sp.]|uniref:anthranilate synthase n=1 Tax=Marivibrio sp. TaxID=2039719 RepID=UPI0032EF0A13